MAAALPPRSLSRCCRRSPRASTARTLSLVSDVNYTAVPTVKFTGGLPAGATTNAAAVAILTYNGTVAR